MHALNITILYLYIYMCTVGFLFSNAELIPKVLGQTWCALVIFFLVGGMSTYSKDFVLVVVEHYIYNLNMHD